MQGWVKLHRALMGWEWYSDHNATRVWLHLLMTCNHAPRIWRGVQINPGQTITGRKELSAEVGLSEQQLRTQLNKLKSTNNITIKSNNHFSIITIVNWDEYQGEQPTDTPTDNQQIHQPITTPKEVKKLRKKDIIEGDACEAMKRWNDFKAIFPKQRAGSWAKAEIAYRSAVKRGFSEDQIYAGVEAYANSDEVRRGFAKGAAAWLNDDRFSNDYSTKNLLEKMNGQGFSTGTGESTHSHRNQGANWSGRDDRDPATRARDEGERIIAERRARWAKEDADREAAAKQGQVGAGTANQAALPGLCQPASLRGQGSDDGIPRPDVSDNSGRLRN